MKILAIILGCSAGLLSQNLAGTWIIERQFLNDEIAFDKPYLKYEFIPSSRWKSHVRKGYDKGPFDFEDGGTYAVRDGELGLSYWNEEEVSWGKYSIEGDTLLMIEFLYDKEKVSMVFKREKKPPEI